MNIKFLKLKIKCTKEQNLQVIFLSSKVVKMEKSGNDFRAYLHSAGVFKSLVTAVVSLHQMRNRPENPVEFIRQHLPPVQEDTVDSLTRELDELKEDITAIRKIIAHMEISDCDIESGDESENESCDSEDRLGCGLLKLSVKSKRNEN